MKIIDYDAKGYTTKCLDIVNLMLLKLKAVFI